VCHQAANRILIAARITVEGARGYGVSHAIYGVYGRVGMFPCSSPFDQQVGVAGDLPPCVPTSAEGAAERTTPLHLEDQADAAYIKSVLDIYEANARLFTSQGTESRDTIAQFHLELFDNLLSYKLGGLLDDESRNQLMDVRRSIEERLLSLDERHGTDALTTDGLAREVDLIAADLQNQVAAVATDAQYESLFGLRKGDVVGLADPAIIGNL
jgi:hypothetical protein